MIFPTLLRFQDFISEINYAALQYKFASYDEKYNGLLDSKFENSISSDFNITYKIDEDEYIELPFYDAFLYPKINELAKTNINKIQKKLSTEFLYDKDKSEIFIKKTLDECYKIESTIEEATFLNSKIKNRLSSQMKIVLEYLNNDYLKQFEFNDKFQFKLMERDLLVLLTLLRNKRQLVNDNESLLGHLIERHFECFDETTQSFKKIQKAGKKLNDFKNSQKTIEKSITRLKDLLQNDSFYEL